MKRTFPQRVKSVEQPTGDLLLPGVMESAVASASSAQDVDGVARRLRQLLPEPTRGLRQSVAVLGLAVSVGAAGLLINQQKQREGKVDPIPFSSRTLGDVLSQNSAAKYEAAAKALEAGELDDVKGVTLHTVEPGQTLWQLTQIYQVDAAAITVSNGISANTELKPGQILAIPPVNGLLHQVHSGETLESIAQFYKVAQKDISRYSELADANRLAIGQELVIPGDVSDLLKIREEAARRRLEAERARLQQRLSELHASGVRPVAPAQPKAAAKPKTPAQPKLTTYQVRQGDTVEVIAQRHGVSQQVLVETNRLSNPSRLQLNQILKIPVRPTAGQASSAPLSLNTQVSRSVAPTHLEPQARAAAPQVDTSRAIVWNDLVNRSGQAQARAIETLAEPPAPTPASATAPVAPKFTVSRPTVAAEPRASVGGSISPSVTDSQVTLAAAPAPEVAPAAVPKAPNVTASRPTVAESRRSESEVAFTPSVSAQAANPVALAAAPAPEAAPATAPVAPAIAQPRPVTAAAPSLTLATASAAGPSSPVLAETVADPAPAPEALQSLEGEVEQLQAQVRATERQARLEAAARARQAAAETRARQSAQSVVTRRQAQSTAPSLPALEAHAYLPSEPAATATNAAISAEGFIWPSRGVLTSGYGQRWGRLHAGIDIAAPVGTPIMAAASGEIIVAGWDSGGYGYKIDIRHENGTVTRYAHLSRILVQVGQQVNQGEHIGAMGSTGFSTGPHLHFEVRPGGGRAVNPRSYLP
ncbi:peptidoglycan DD-metalloendopeptidase family protein [Leptolyngbya sp. FACHB-261]|uniref:peptidoglycan DD-metalloendopeptidase family protein n=1 Tax=Leptolyngbya sp. FACHB-261 TaxID=2692806 RepID=UPI0016838DF0|nr:peptidoglycan DD-metalloendopeptidase family protein [Leptolyngbya sp. FACHB-261]MBD2104584.1 peptidoglycan DD-metalloendopeptidase family protein [Leptolyngbya sp. FACHB-261]